MTSAEQSRKAREIARRAKELRERVGSAGDSVVLADAEQAAGEAGAAGETAVREPGREPELVDRLLDEAAMLLTLAYKQAEEGLAEFGQSLDMATPDLPGKDRAGRIERETTYRADDGTELVASPDHSERTPHYFPGGSFRGCLIPEGRFSRAFWNDVTFRVTAAGIVVVTWGVFAGKFADRYFPGGGSRDKARWELLSDLASAAPSGGGKSSGGFLDFLDFL
ncbi:hypothetical protein ACFPM7_14140 [Actinokineospora guangxiensis]|uniref:Uncharacterized protein n=1 Tax=Actinokineospora guangxiensis TaxID=1490288 RepID=A0ABW0EPX8_9PSEU